MPTFAERLRGALASRNLSQAELARRLNVNRQSVYHWTSGHTPAPTIDSTVRIAEAIGCEASELEPRLGKAKR